MRQPNGLVAGTQEHRSAILNETQLELEEAERILPARHQFRPHDGGRIFDADKFYYANDDDNIAELFAIGGRRRRIVHGRREIADVVAGQAEQLEADENGLHRGAIGRDNGRRQSVSSCSGGVRESAADEPLPRRPEKFDSTENASGQCIAAVSGSDDRIVQQ